jgi:hypothetical protein
VSNTLTDMYHRIDALQRRCDALKGRRGYPAMLQRLRDARHAALMAEVRNG